MSYQDPGMMKHMGDAELIASYKATKDKRYVGELYMRYSHLVMGMCVGYFRDRDLAKDMVLAIFEKLFDELGRREVENFKAWLTFVVRNFCISELRKMQTRSQQEQRFQEELPLQEEEQVENHTDNDLQLLESALKELNPFQKKCIELFYYKNMSYAQIVEFTGYSVNEVKSYIQNGKRNLRIMISSSK